MTALALELLRVARALPAVEHGLAAHPPPAAVARLRARGRRCARRTPAARATLRRAIALADRAAPGGASCYRRALLELALDAGAAAETLWLGLDASGLPRSGHAWLGDAPPDRPYAITLSL